MTLVGGALADAFDRRRLMLVQQAGMVVGASIALANAAAPHPQVWPCYLSAFALVSSFALGAGAQNALVPRLVSDAKLAAANNLVSLAADVAEAVDERAQARPLGVAARRNWRQQPHRLGMPTALFPALATHRFHDPSLVGYLYSATYAGALVASALGGWAGHVRRQGLVVVAAATLWGAAIAAFGFASQLWLALLLLAVAGGADLVSAVLRGTMLLQLTPDSLRGRLSGIRFAQVASAPALGNLEAGALASVTSIRLSIVSGGVASVVGCLLLALAFPALIRYDSRSREPAVA